MPYTWTAPPTWGPTDVPDENDLNDLMENLRFLRTKDRCHVYLTADENTAGAGTWEALLFDAEESDNNTMHSNVTNKSRVTVQTDGTYWVSFKVVFDSNGTGARKVMLRKNANASDTGGTTLGTWTVNNAGGSNPCSVTGSRLVPLSITGTNDYIELFVSQDSGSTLAVRSGASVSYLQVVQYTG